jgi:hypothetical protein
LIFDHHHYFKTVEPVGPQIISEVRFFCDPTDANVKIVGNESADVVEGTDFFDSRGCSFGVKLPIIIISPPIR